MINAAIVGLGRWGERLVTSVQGRSERIRFVRGMVRNPDKVRELANAHGFDLSADFADVLSDRRVQAVVLATPHTLHVEQIIAAARTGKAVLCEKPQRRELEPVDPVRVSLESFADAVSGRTPYPMSTDEIVGTVAVFEAAVRSMETRSAVMVGAT